MAQLTIQLAFDLALQHHQAGRLREAEQLYRQVLAQQPGHAGALHYLGVMAYQMERNDIAVDLIRQAVAIMPNWPEAHSNLGSALQRQGRLDEAIAACRQALILKPDYPEAQNNLGNALKDKGLLNEAIAAYGRAIALQPSFPEAHNNLGIALQDMGHVGEAVAAYRRAITLMPNYPEAYNNLGHALKEKGDVDEAVAACRQAVALKPDSSEAHNNLGNALKDKGLLDEAIAAYRQALAVKPDSPDAHSSLVFTLHYHPAFDAPAIAGEHHRWNRQHAEPLKQFIRPHPNDRSPERRLKIGYVSPDLCDHVVARFLLPLLRHHDHTHFEIYCYAQVPRPDAVTEQLRPHADQWRSLVGLSDERAADLIRQDGIDILVDLAGHTAGNRLLVFARKPAPVQVSYLGYPGTTGLETMDYRLTDAVADPPGLTDGLYSERLVRLPQTAWCLEPPQASPAVARPPSISRGYVTFGTLNNFAKVSQISLGLWARILRQVPESRLLLKGPAMTCADVISRLRQFFAAQEIAADRLELVPWEPAAAKHLTWYDRLDVALDTFPYHGTTTTCEALWMGVPVVTLAGETHVSRVGASLLSSVGLGELVGHSEEQYVSIAVALASDRGRLMELRATLRPRMQESPLMDGPRFARGAEDAYRGMWRQWCVRAG